MKFLHTLGAIGFTGALLAELVLSLAAPSPTDVPGYAAIRSGMSVLATWVFLPSLGLTLVAGLFAMALTTAYQNAGWAWLKLATGVLVFEGFVHIQGAMQAEARTSAEAVAGRLDAATLGQSAGAERWTLALVLVIAAINVALGVWRPRLSAPPKPAKPKRTFSP